MSFTDRAALVHARTHMRLYGRVRTYTRTDGSTAELKLAPGKTDAETRDPEGMVVSVRVDDWLCLVDDFRAAFGADAEPEDDDVITADGRRYLVKPTSGEPCARFSDFNRVMFRIHSKDDGADA